MKQVNIGVGYRLVVFVDDGACQMALSFMGTLHIDFTLSTLYDSDGIETNNLHDGLRDSLMLDAGSHAEVFEFIVDKGDVVISGLFLNLLQGIGKGDVLKGVRDLLCVCNSYNGTH